MLDVPYGEAFRLQECWLANHAAEDDVGVSAGKPTLQAAATARAQHARAPRA